MGGKRSPRPGGASAAPGAAPDPVAGPPRPWTATAEALTLRVRLTPKGGRDALDGIATLADGTAVLKARVRAAAQDNEANTALKHLIARALGVAPGRVRLLAGASARIKTLTIEGDGAASAAAMETLMAAGQMREDQP